MVISNQLTSLDAQILKYPDLHRQVHSHHYLNKIKKTNKKKLEKLEMVISNQLTSLVSQILKCSYLHRQIHSHHYY